MIDVARRLSSGAELRVGAIEHLPWSDERFDVVTGFNAFQFTADIVAALAQAGRVARGGGQVAVCDWDRREGGGMLAVMGALSGPPPTPPTRQPSPDPPAVGEPGVVEELCRRAGLDPLRAGEVEVSFEAPDRQTLERALLTPGAVLPAIEQPGERAVREAIAEAAEPFRRPDGSYRFQNSFRYVISEVPAQAGG